MDDLIESAAAPATRSLIEDLASRLAEADPNALCEAALARGELRSAVNLALAGALAGSPPPARLAARLVPVTENTDLVITLLGSVRSGLADALIESSTGALHSPSRQALILFLAASSLEGRPPPDELLRRIRLTARAELGVQAAVLLGRAAMEVDDPDVLEVAGEWVAVADGPGGRHAARDILRRLRAPLLETLPEEAPGELFGGFTIRRDAPRTGRNDPCPCGSGKKYKRCCLGKEPDADPTPDTARPWGDRARFHRSMTDAQFMGLHPLELARIPPEDLDTVRLLHAIRTTGEHRLADDALRLVGELERREDLPRGKTVDDFRTEVLTNVMAGRDLTLTQRVLDSFADPDAVPEHLRVSLAILRRSPDALERIEAMADRALREPSEEALGRLAGVLIFFSPALGVLLARGTMDPETPHDVERTLDLVEEARDCLLLPPHDPAWEVFDLLSERHFEAQLGISALDENEALAEEAEALRHAVAEARTRERSARRALEEKQRELENATRDAEERREAAERTRTPDGPSPEEVRALREKVEEFKVRIAEGNEERRALRRRLSRVGSQIAAAAREEPQPDREEAADDPEYGEDLAPDRPSARIPVFSREFREGLGAVADHVARDAVATAGALAAADPGAWSSVKKLRLFDDLLSCRIGTHRILFRRSGDDEVEFHRLIHRRDLIGTLKRMA